MNVTLAEQNLQQANSVVGNSVVSTLYSIVIILGTNLLMVALFAFGCCGKGTGAYVAQADV